MKIKIGKYVNTHGIKGEIRIISKFSRKDLIFVPNFDIYINDNKYTIENYRHHKEYDMVTLKDINNINDILYLKGSDVYADDESLHNVFLEENINTYKVIINDTEYKIKDLIDNYKQKILVLENGKMIPFVDDFITKKDDENKTIYMNVPEYLV